MRRWSTSCPRFIGNSCWFIYEDCRHEESTPQVSARERAFKRSSEGQRLNNLIREKNVDGFLPKSVGAYMNAAEGLASEAEEAALRKARKYTDAAGGKISAPVTGTKLRNQSASTCKQKRPGCGSFFDHVYKDCVDSYLEKQRRFSSSEVESNMS